MRKHFKFILGLALGAIFLFWFAARLDWPQVWQHLRSADLKLIVVAAALVSLTYLIRSLRWQMLLAPIQTTRVSHLFAANVIGFSAIFLFGRTGEVVRPVVAALRERLKFTAALATIFLERVLDMSAILLIFSLSLLFLDYEAVSESNRQIIARIRPVAWGLLLLIPLGIGFLLLLRAQASRIVTWLRARQRGAFLWRHLAHLINSLAEGVSVLRGGSSLLATIGLTTLLWALITAATYLVLLAFGIALSLPQAAFLLGLEMLGSLVPVPGGAAGAFHTAVTSGLLLLGIEANLAGGCAIVLHLVTFSPALIFGIFYIVRDGLSLSALQHLGEDLSLQPERLRLNPD